MREKLIEKKFCEKVKKLNGIAFKFVSPGMAGVPDRIILFPRGQVYFIEMKAEGKKLRPIQEKRKREIESLGFKFLVIDSEKGIEEFLKEVSK